ncbi:MAG: mechanosensitive ion channel family protein [Thermoplasmatota archaeon]
MEHNGTVEGDMQGADAPALEASPNAFQSVLDWFDDPANELAVRLIATAAIFLLSWALMKLSERTLTRSARRYARLRSFDDYQTKVVVGRTKPMRLVIGISIFVLAAISLLGVWGLQNAFTGLLAGAGFAGIVIGLAAADTIGDIVAGFLIFANHPFDIGDWVEIDMVQGYVEDISLGATTLLTFDNEKVTIPNRIVEGSRVKNFTHGRKLRRRLAVGVEYGSHLGLAMKTMVELAKQHPEIMDEPEPMAITAGFGPSSVDLELRYWVEPIRSSVLKTQTDLFHSIHDTFVKKGIKIAFPHMQVVQANPWRLDSRRGEETVIKLDTTPARINIDSPRAEDERMGVGSDDDEKETDRPVTSGAPNVEDNPAGYDDPRDLR